MAGVPPGPVPGRARGRALGRARGQTAPAGAGAAQLRLERLRRPGEPPATTAAEPPVPTQQEGLSSGMQRLVLEAGGDGAGISSCGRGYSRPQQHSTSPNPSTSRRDDEEDVSAGPVGRGCPRTRTVAPQSSAIRKGESGKPVTLRANYFQLNTSSNWASCHQCRLDFAPEVEVRDDRKALLRQHRAELGGYLYDGGNSLFFQQRPEAERVLTSTLADGRSFRLTIRPVGDAVSSSDGDYIRTLNVIMRRCLDGLNLSLVGRHYYDSGANIDVRDFRLTLWPGYQTSIRHHEGGVLMSAEIIHRVLRMETVLDILNECFQRHGAEYYQKRFTERILGCVVITKYNNKMYRIDDIKFNETPLNTFNYRGEEMTYADYMLRKYNIVLSSLTQPMLFSRAKPRDVRAGMAPILSLIPELCTLTGFDSSMRANFQLMRALAQHTRLTPQSRISKLMDFNKRLQTTQAAREVMNQWQVKLGTSLLEVPGRELDEVKILFREGLSCVGGPEADWTRHIRNKPMLVGVELRDWIVMAPYALRKDAAHFVRNMIQAAAAMGFPVSEPHYVDDIPDDRPNTLLSTLRRTLDQKRPQIIFCVLDTKKGSGSCADKYAVVKKHCCIDRSVPTQVILSKNLAPTKGSVMSIATKVAVQMNCKIGGAPWSVDMPKDLMIVGFDVCHDTIGKNLSFGATVASLDRSCSRYYSVVNAHDHQGAEISNHIQTNIINAVRRYRHFNNGNMPKYILVYRDGVGEGQIRHVLSEELTSIRDSLRTEYGDIEVKLAFFIVTKRIITRLFMGSNNPAPGTIVDDVITDPARREFGEFYLVSQSVRQGTVTPTCYTIVWDSTGQSIDRLQRLTYKLCHMYYNWSGTIRVPAPCQYAHKLAFLAGQSLHKEPRRGMEELLYYL